MNMFACLYLRIFWLTLIASLTAISFQAASSVTMTGSRIIYLEGSKSVNVEFKNADAIPYAVQSWFDSGDVNSTAQTGRAPFSASPALFRIMPGSGQVMRIMFTGNPASLPDDRESVFYFNFLQIPPSNALEDTDSRQNKMLVMLKSRVKIFYRPQCILPDAASAPDLIKVRTESANGNVRVHVKNASPLHISMDSITLRKGEKEVKQRAEMISPFAEKTYLFKKVTGGRLTTIIEYISDQGARVTKEYAGN